MLITFLEPSKCTFKKAIRVRRSLRRRKKASIRSVLRGIGPPRQTAALDLNEVFGLNLTDEPLVEDGPVAMTRFFVFACFFVLREIEVPYALSAR